MAPADDFVFQTEQFADVRILRYRVPGFDGLDLRRKTLLYHLGQAALWGRDILWDQHWEGNLRVRRTLEAVLETFEGPRAGAAWEAFLTWAKRVFFANGVHHHTSTAKLVPGCPPEALAAFVRGARPDRLPLGEGEDVEALVAWLQRTLYDPAVAAQRVCHEDGADLVAGSACNFYRGVTQAEVEAFYAARADADDPRPVSWGLNSTLVKDGDAVVELPWRVGGLYGEAIERVVASLRAALPFADPGPQRRALELLVRFYETGDLATFDAYSIAWVEDTDSPLEVVNGFIEVYGDPLGYRGSYESIVSLRDEEATRRIAAISAAAPWFEAHTPILDAHRKLDVTGISARVIQVVAAGGDASPTLPLGVNLPNADWIRKQHGSKSVNLGNVAEAYFESSRQAGIAQAFAATDDEVARHEAHGYLAGNLHTDLHEVIGHASGRLEPGVAPPNETLKSYASVLEEARADLVALWFLLDPKLVELGVMPTLDVGRAAYDHYVRNGLLVQLARVAPGESLQQAHMRNRQLVASWVLEQGRPDGVIEPVRRPSDGGTAFAIRDHEALRGLFGRLLREVQRIKSQGDHEAGRDLVETYGVRVDADRHAEVRERWARLGIAPYAGFINPRLEAVREGDRIVDVHIRYPDDFLAQMLAYGRDFATLSPVGVPLRRV